MKVKHIENRLDQQLAVRSVILQAYDNLVKVGLDNITNERINTRLSSLKETWEKFSMSHDDLTISISKLNSEDKVRIQGHRYMADELFSDTYEVYLDTLEKFNLLIDANRRSATASETVRSLVQGDSVPSSSHAVVQHTRLPRITIPTFSGTPSEWLSFKDLFTSIVINNPSVSAVEKLQYLKTNLVGSAALLIKDTVLIADNFPKAWELLSSFYENKRILVQTEMHSLFSLKRLTRESASDLEQLYSKIGQSYRTLESLGCPVEHWDAVLVYVATRRLDSDSLRAWENELGSSKETPTWAQFSKFLLARIFSLQSYEKSRYGKPVQQPRQTAAKVHFQGQNKGTSTKINHKCILCSGPHTINFCPQYNNKTIEQKKAIIVKHKLCYNCLFQHKISNCRITTRCKKCGKKHHTSIHFKSASDDVEAKNSNVKNEPPSVSSKPEAKVLHSTIKQLSIVSHVLLATAQVMLISNSGQITKVRALLDQGSEISIISERVVQRLQLSRSHSAVKFVGVGSLQSKRTLGVTSFILKPHFNSETEYVVSAYILPKLTSLIPSSQLDSSSWSHLTGLELADPAFVKPGSIDLILGVDMYSRILQEGIIKGNANAPIAQSTTLGWVISGTTDSTGVVSEARGHHVRIDQDLCDLLQKFWELEVTPVSKPVKLSSENQKCEDHFKATHQRDATGRYIVRLPFKDDVSKLGNSKIKATRIIHNLFHRFKDKPDYAEAYTDFIKEYEDLHHMERIPPTDIEPEHVYYLPHHGVMREHSLTTKLRVVFNGSSCTTSGISLNQLLHAGEKLQLNLSDVLTWFRLFPFVFFTDAEKMYRQILIHPADWNFQRILWLNHLNELIIFALITVTYGLTCAPFLALRTVEQLIEDEGHKYPFALPTMKKGKYIDDVFGGANTIEQAKLVVDQVNRLFMAGGFPLHKWVSNNPEILESIPVDKRIELHSLQIEETTVHTLGLCWQPSTDVFRFTLNLNIPKIHTKRTVLSTIAKLFDPLGLLSPIIISAKIFLQELWCRKLEWDDSLPSSLSDQWTKFLNQLQEIPNFTFPRWLGFNTTDYIEIHGFCDASSKAMAAVIYIRSVSKEGQVTVNLVSSKTKVAPLKKLTIPRLELSGAVLLVKLMTQVLTNFERKDIPLYAWIDSSVAHTWITNHPSKWKDFVQNRVCWIQEALPQLIWNFIPGKQNPADCATRGLTPTQLMERSEWKFGPHWLRQDPSTWPKEAVVLSSKDNLEERPVQVSTVTKSDSSKIWDLLYRYSNFIRLLRITAWCFRVCSRFKRLVDSSHVNPLSTQELQQAKYFWVKMVQQESFNDELKLISRGQNLSKSNSLARLTPKLDSNGLLRVGGRLQHSLLSEDAKHPLILPRDSALSSLIIADAHSRTMHGGAQVTLTVIRNEYWIIGGRAPVRSFILKCVKCARYRQLRAQQLMGQLPPERVTPSRPFLHSGVDYAGPFTIKTWKGKNAKTYKAYVALFVCEVTSAVHMELVTDYTTDAFIAAYKRFTSRRGICATLRSDCGTNFKGADSELTKLFQSSSSEANNLAALLANDGTQWIFNPPSAPHFGGKWEAGVKSFKYHFKRVIGETRLTYEEFTTLLIQIEAVLNSRPLSPLSEDPDDLNALTPGHFLIGSSLSLIPEPSLEEINVSRLSRWQLNRHILECFWARWSKECLQRYMSTYKWNQENPSIKEGSMVLVIDERYPPSKWPLGRIIETYPGEDGFIRVVSVRTQTTVLKRPVAKLCPLPIPINEK